ncbi:DUF4132 domain-containing protein [Janthinobacterium sp. RB2R34]|uniref:DUF4132 domain-containing protein n=1 Tax=Janthinobacterium sp. RB2R34 TaxID=3424193 RepID=UPI003F21CBBC
MVAVATSYRLTDVPLGDDAFRLLQDNRAQLLQMAHRKMLADQEAYPASPHPLQRYQQVEQQCAWWNDGRLHGLLRAVNGETGEAGQCFSQPLASELLRWKNRLAALPGVGFMHLARYLLATRHRSRLFWSDEGFTAWLARQPAASIDLRVLDQCLRAAGDMQDAVGLACLAERYWSEPYPHAVLPAQCIWPFFEQRPDLIEQGLGMAADPRSPPDRLQLDATLGVLATFPVLPQRWLPRVLELALGEAKASRGPSQRLLHHVPDIASQVAASLASQQQELRMRTAEWLGRLGDKRVVPALYRALRQEKREAVSAVLMSALELLGEDLAPLLAPDALLAQARKGLKARPPAGLSWFDFPALPPCSWLDATPVEMDIVRWWLVLACKLREPAGNALLRRYLGLLQADSRAALGLAVLRQFIAHDTRILKSTLYGFEVIDYVGSAIGEKGVLALASHASGKQAVSLVQDYMREHYLRRAQIEALLESLAAGCDPAVIQLLLAVARRYRTAAIQDRARLLVERVAAAMGWSAGQLADRTIPYAGLDDSGRLALQYGQREYVVTLGAAVKPVLHNAEGKLLAALPEPRQDDDPASIKEGKRQLSICKKSVAQVVALETARLYEAMCTGRLWAVDEWRQYLHRHPITGRLLQQLVWLEMAPDGALLQMFRPTEDGCLIDVQDNDVTLKPGSLLRLAHAVLLDEPQIAAWRRHLADYKITPLFAQFDHRLPAGALLAGLEIDDRLGWSGNNFSLRTAFGKRNYVRAVPVDGGVFDAYLKDFAGAGLRVRIGFTGSQLPEERQPAALTTLSFQRLKDLHVVTLAEVPPVLLAEAYADYHAVALSCGYDEFWESRTPF